MKPHTGTDAEQLELPYIASGNSKWYSPWGKQFHSFFKSHNRLYNI